MKINKYTVLFVSFIAAVTVSTMLIFSDGEKTQKEEEEVTRRQDNIEESDPPTTEPVGYEVLLEDSRVTLYRLTGGEKTAIDSVEIDTNYYPDSDIKELSKGISAYNEEEGYKILENFAN